MWLMWGFKALFFSKKADGEVLSAMDPAKMMPGKTAPAPFVICSDLRIYSL
jgi:hypothetical protein